MSEACWVLTYPNGEDFGFDNSEGAPHFATAEAAQAAGRFFDPSNPPLPRRLDQPCIIVACVCCECVFNEDEEGAAVHFANRTEVQQMLPDFGWKAELGADRCEMCVILKCETGVGTHG